MNEFINYIDGELGQSSKGHWYCKSLHISNSTVGGFINETDKAVMELEKVLLKYNKNVEGGEE